MIDTGIVICNDDCVKDGGEKFFYLDALRSFIESL